MARVHVTRNGKPRYQLWYTDPVTEKRRWRSTDTTDRREAERAAARWEADLESLDEALDRRITWDAFHQRYQAEHLAGLSAASQATAGTALGHFETLVQPARLASITPAVLSRWVAQLRRRGLSDTSVRTYCKHLRAALGWAKTQRLLAEVPQFPTIKTVARETMMRGRPITGEEFDRLLDAVPRLIPAQHVPVWHLYLRSLWLSGLRLAESVKLSWDQTEPFCLTWESGPGWR
jgi:site-specific recombinase XerC